MMSNDTRPRPDLFSPTATWAEYFEWNATHPVAFDFDGAWAPSEAEHRAVSRSIAVFQLGERSDGKYLKEAARRYAGVSGDRMYPRAVDAFIAEENRHAMYLERFMTQYDIPFLESEWTDNMFRLVRRLAGLEISVSVLVTAEIVATTYYQALRDATASRFLRSVCEEILRDEASHLQFQAATLGHLQCQRPAVLRHLVRNLCRLFLGGTLLVVWWGHSRVYRAGGFGFWRFVKETWRAFECTQSMVERVAKTSTQAAEIRGHLPEFES